MAASSSVSSSVSSTVDSDPVGSGVSSGPVNSGAVIGELFTAPGRADPYPLYAKLHELGPASHVDGAMFVANAYDEVNAVLRNSAFGKWSAADIAAIPELAEHASLMRLNKSILDANPPDHTRVRRLMATVFTPRRTAALGPAVADIVGKLLDSMADAGADGSPIDFMDSFAFRVPVSVICELLGIPEADRYRFRALMQDVAIALEVIGDLSVLAPADIAMVELEEYFTALVAARRAAPRDDLTSALIHDADQGDGRLSEEELLGNLVLLLLAGFETTTNLIGNALAVLFDRPQLAAGLRAGTVPVAGFVEEVLRYDSPVQLTSRLAMADGLQVAGIPVPKGSEVLLLLGAANHDSARFPEPERFDPGRPDNQPLSFGAGAHYCLGAALARLEAVTAIPLLLNRFPDLAPAKDAERIRTDRLVLRGYQTFPVALR